ncbi:MAG: C39 family peptidase [Candidatus Rokubacteria bacterium]|nr:C39 family peptidase [Candidatus Rokubacteria bacterium]
MTLPGGRTLLPRAVPYVPQFASPDLTADILAGRLDPAADPRWAESGYPSVAAYAFWAPRLCGIACLMMAIRAVRPAFAGSLAALATECAGEGGYVLWDAAGRWVDYGWVYEPMLRVARRYGLEGAVSTALGFEDVCAAVLRDVLVIASVNPSHVRGQRLVEPFDPGGHLVVVVGFDAAGGRCEAVLCHNPSGTTAATREAGRVEAAVFRRAFAGRGLLLWPASTPSPRWGRGFGEGARFL